MQVESGLGWFYILSFSLWHRISSHQKQMTCSDTCHHASTGHLQHKNKMNPRVTGAYNRNIKSWFTPKQKDLCWSWCIDVLTSILHKVSYTVKRFVICVLTWNNPFSFLQLQCITAQLHVHTHTHRAVLCGEDIIRGVLVLEIGTLMPTSNVMKQNIKPARLPVAKHIIRIVSLHTRGSTIWWKGKKLLKLNDF